MIYLSERIRCEKNQEWYLFKYIKRFFISIYYLQCYEASHLTIVFIQENIVISCYLQTMVESLCRALHITKHHVVSNAVLDTLPQGQLSEPAWPQETIQCTGVAQEQHVKVWFHIMMKSGVNFHYTCSVLFLSFISFIFNPTHQISNQLISLSIINQFSLSFIYSNIFLCA